MVKIIITFPLLAAALATYRWPDDVAGVLSTVALVIFSLAGGIAVSNLKGVVGNGRKK